jgi:selenocysteine-specific elongation factor
LLPAAPPLKDRSRVRLHVGTAEILSVVKLLDTSRLAPGASALAQLHLAEPAVTTWNQPLVIRRESPVVTIGGGRVLDPSAQRISRLDPPLEAQLRRLENGDPAARAGATLYLAGLRGWRAQDLPRLAGVSDSDAASARLLASGELQELRTGPTSVTCIHRDVLAQVAERAVATLEAIYDHQPLRVAIPRSELGAKLSEVEPAVLESAIALLAEQGRLQRSRLGLVLAGRGPKLSRGQEQLFEQLLEWFRAANLETPNLADCVARAPRNKESVGQLIEIAVAGRQLVAIAPDYWLDAEVERQTRAKVAAAFPSGRGVTLSEIRELLATTRKYAVPLCEHWDRTGFTRRQGDLRFVAGAG